MLLESEALYRQTAIEQTKSRSGDVESFVSKVKEENEEFDTKIENVKLAKLVENLKKENAKIPKMKYLATKYKNELSEKSKKVIELKKENQVLYSEFKKIPKFVRKIFIKVDDIRLVDERK